MTPYESMFKLMSIYMYAIVQNQFRLRYVYQLNSPLFTIAIFKLLI